MFRLRQQLNHQWQTRLKPAGVLPALLLVMLGSGCSSLLESKHAPAETWWLEPPTLSETTPDTQAPRLSLHVAAVPGLDSDRVLNLNPDARLNHYAGAHWPEHVPELVGSLLSRSLAASGRFAAVVLRETPGRSACHIDLEVREFFGRLDAGDLTRSVSVELAGELHCNGATRPLAAQVSQGVSGSGMAGIVAAFQAALDQAFQELAGQF